MRTAIVGGGAAGFFLAVNLKEMCPQMEVVIFEKSKKVLAKVEVSGGGRCNCTNSFASVSDLQQVYPRGHRLMKRLMKGFGHEDAYAWFERHGVPLTTQTDECVFPKAQDSHAIINCFVSAAQRHGVDIRTGCGVESLDELASFDFICVTTGGQPRAEGLRWLAEKGHETVSPAPSLFTFSIRDDALKALTGTVVEGATAFIPGTGFRATGPLLVTHWGMSGPAILKLSSHAARHLAEQGYRSALSVNWLSLRDTEVADALRSAILAHPQKLLPTVSPLGLPARLWEYLLKKALGDHAACRWSALGKKDVNKLANQLCNDSYQIVGRAAFKDEFVTCGGVALSAVNPSTLESRHVENLYFAGEVLDIDGVTGGFNFQAAWTTSYTVAQSICKKVMTAEP
ncbi:MAG: aminoacetone oxidase family FAD-binding enzyme [Prevotella sp.]|nr:aminoacetone oxidase family FAD-binding enzyme [Prevotella sp.]